MCVSPFVLEKPTLLIWIGVCLYLSGSGSKSVCATLSLISLRGARRAAVRQGCGAVNESRWPLPLRGIGAQPSESATSTCLFNLHLKAWAIGLTNC